MKRLHVVYPRPSVQSHITHTNGSVAFAFTLTEKGAVESIWLLVPLGAGLDEAAEDSIKQSTYAPAQVDGQPVGSVTFQRVNFSGL